MRLKKRIPMLIILLSVVVVTIPAVVRYRAVSSGALPPHDYAQFVAWAVSKPESPRGTVANTFGYETFGSDAVSGLKWAIRGKGIVTISGWSDGRQSMTFTLEPEPPMARALFPELSFTNGEIAKPRITVGSGTAFRHYSDYGEYRVNAGSEHLTLSVSPSS